MKLISEIMKEDEKILDLLIENIFVSAPHQAELDTRSNDSKVEL